MRQDVCNVMRPAETKNSRGQERGKDAVIVRDWQCSILSLGGSEVEIGGSVFPQASFEVTGDGNPRTPIVAKDYLLLRDGRRLDISFVNDVKQNGRLLVLSCGERAA